MKAIDWKIVLSLSLFGLAMGVATVFFIPSKTEPIFWLAIFVACAVIIARRCKGSYFLNGLFVSLVNSVWITTAHVVLFDAYAASHAQEVSMAAQMGSPRLMMLMTGPVVGLVSGLILGLFSWIASKLVPAAPAARA